MMARVSTQITIRTVARLAALLTAAALLGGCGFHLRGNQVLSAGADNLYVSGNSLLRREIEVFLEGSDTKVLSSADGADVLLSVSGERYERRVLSVDPDSGKAREFQLAYSVNLNARSPDGEVLLPPQSVSLLRDFVFDEDQLLGKSREEVVLKIEMRQDAAQQILYRLRSVAKR